MVSAKVSDAASILSAYTSNVSKVNSSKGTDFSEMLKKSTTDTTKQTQEESINKSIKTEDAGCKKLEDVEKSEIIEKDKTVADKEIEDADIPTDEEIAKIATLVVDIRKEIADTLNITVEELNEYLDVLSVDISALKEPENMMKLIMEVKGISNQSEVLLDSELSANVKDLIMKLTDIVDEMPEITDAIKQQIAVMDNVDDVVVNVDANEENQITYNENAEDETVVDISGDAIRDKFAEITANNGNSEMSKESDKHSKNEDTFSNVVNTVNVTANTEIIDGLNEAVSYVTGSYSDAEVISQIIERIKVSAKPGMSSMELQLYPEHLGKVTVQVVSKNGGITANIAAENENVKAIIENQLITLKNAFIEQGIKVDSVEVTVANYGFEQHNNDQKEEKDQQSKRNGNVRKSLLDELNGKSFDTEEVIEETRMETIGNTVSYKA